MKKYSIEAWVHSADKDHTNMTWGTLSVDKIVHCDDGITFFQYSIPLYTWIFDETFHKWVHTAEHLLAYKKDTGSVRNSLEEVSNSEIDWKVILDISPYKTGSETFWFRITSMIQLDINQVEKFVQLSISRAIDFLEHWVAENTDDYMGIPFARAISCGQFDFHDKQKAIRDLRASQDRKLNIYETKISTTHTSAYVCDLRFLKPKVSSNDWLIMFTPNFSYKISHIIEEKLPLKLENSIVIVGTFGCMTGMYLCISSPVWDAIDIHNIHAKIIEVVHENIAPKNLSKEENEQLKQLLYNYEQYWKTT